MDPSNRTLDPGASLNTPQHFLTGKIPPLVTNILVWTHDDYLNPRIETQWPSSQYKEQFDFIKPTLMSIAEKSQLENVSSTTVPFPITTSPPDRKSWLYILSLKGSSTQKQQQQQHIGIITEWPVFESLNPILTFFLTQLVNGELISLPMIYDKLNSSHINELIHHLSFISPQERSIRIKINSMPLIPSSLSSHFSFNGDDLIKCSLDFISMTFPIHLSMGSILASKNCFFGFDLKRSDHLNYSITKLLNLNVKPTINCDMVPYNGINGLHILINGLLLNKNIIVFGNDNHTEINTFIEIISSIVDDNDDDQVEIWPHFNSSLLPYLTTTKNYILGTNDSSLNEKCQWQIFIDLNSNSIEINSNFNETKPQLNKFFDSGTQLNLNEYIDFDPIFWDPQWFPEIGGIEYTNIDQLGDLNLNLTSNKMSRTFKGKPQIDAQIDAKLNFLIINKHDDLTIYSHLNNYIDNLITISNSIKSFQTILILNDFKVYLKELVDVEEYEKGIKKFIIYHKLTLPMPLIYNYQINRIPLPDFQMFKYYSTMVLPNYQLIQLSSSLKIKSNNHLFNWDGINLNLDTHYLIHLIDNSFSYNSINWSLPKSALLQIFKILNILLKSNMNKEGIINQFFIDSFIGSLSDIGNEPFDKFNISNYNRDLIEKININSSTKSIQTNGISRLTKLILIASLYKNLNGPEDIVETKKGLRRRDLVLYEFKKFISHALNIPIIKDLILKDNVDDFIKLIINDFIDANI